MDETTEKKDGAKEALRWLYLGIAGLVICVVSLGFHFTGASSEPNPSLPTAVMKQVFGFTPYYFEKDNPPKNFNLKTDTTKFLGNALSYDLTNTKGQTIKVSEQTVPADFKNSKNQGDRSFDIDQGNATLTSPRDGQISGTLTTKEKTFILLSAPESVSMDTLEDLLRGFIPIPETD